MRVLHVCLAAFYIDNFGYQENILPKIHKIQGHEVKILASTETYMEDKTLGYVEPSSYLNEHGIEVTRIPYVSFLPNSLAKKIRLYPSIYPFIEDFSPDIIFLHDTQFANVKALAKYKSMNKGVKIFADSHTDYVNSARNWVSLEILHKRLYRFYTQKLVSIVDRFYGTLPTRNIFMQEVYRVPKEKISLLPLGADDSELNLEESEKIYKETRSVLNISEEDIVLVTGGKLDSRKNIPDLIKVFAGLQRKDVHLIVIGLPTPEMEQEINSYKGTPNLHLVGWQTPKNISKLLLASDLAAFPGTHSVLWEQAIGLGIPCLFKYWENLDHLDLGGNCIFIESKEDLQNKVERLLNEPELLSKMRNLAREKGVPFFSYSQIAKRAIQI